MAKTKRQLEQELEETKTMVLKMRERIHPFVFADMPYEISSWLRSLKKEDR